MLQIADIFFTYLNGCVTEGLDTQAPEWGGESPKLAPSGAHIATLIAGASSPISTSVNLPEATNNNDTKTSESQLQTNPVGFAIMISEADQIIMLFRYYS